jgi:hypothetical protein
MQGVKRQLAMAYPPSKPVSGHCVPGIAPACLPMPFSLSFPSSCQLGLKKDFPYHSQQRKGLIDKDHRTHGWLQSISSPDEKSA